MNQEEMQQQQAQERTPSLDQPVDIQRMAYIEVIQNLMECGQIEKAKKLDEDKKIGYFQKVTKSHYWLEQFITVNPAMIRLKEQVLRLADPRIVDPCLIIGETGTGKELIAKALHGDRMGNFVEVNCAGLPETLMESELFGHVKGSFTGADSDKKGLIEFAGLDKQGNKARGTLFLDEIGELPLSVQAKLLRTLQDKQVRRVGANKSIEVDFRLVCATNKKIDNAEDKSFRRDLYFRISTIEFFTLPLRSRKEDIEPILRTLMEKEFEKPTEAFKSMLEEVRQSNIEGNVRGLQRRARRYQLLGI